MLYEIRANLFNAVLACAAVADNRYYLKTFFIDAERKQIVATNGHIMAIAPLDEVTEETSDVPTEYSAINTRGWLYQAIKKPVSKSVEVVEIDTSKDSPHLVLHGTRYKGLTAHNLTPVDGRFPDYARAQANIGDDAQPMHHIGISPEYLARIARWTHMTDTGCSLNFQDKVSAIEVFYPELPELHVTLMPYRV